ncbi:hypothetical protein HK098_000345 [Nowakowskiella sp. JEL0407]|nr:hypothetical protein HK098_000345 [Nowakowskiella sp. JEL0407]
MSGTIVRGKDGAKNLVKEQSSSSSVSVPPARPRSNSLDTSTNTEFATLILGKLSQSILNSMPEQNRLRTENDKNYPAISSPNRLLNNSDSNSSVSLSDSQRNSQPNEFSDISREKAENINQNVEKLDSLGKKAVDASCNQPSAKLLSSLQVSIPSSELIKHLSQHIKLPPSATPVPESDSIPRSTASSQNIQTEPQMLNEVTPATSPSTAIDDNAALGEKLKENYSAFLHNFHHLSSCKIKISHHVDKFSNPFKVHSQSFYASSLFNAIKAAGGIRAWSTIARQLGFDPSKATSISYRIKKWLQDHHIDSFFNYSMGLLDDANAMKSSELSKRVSRKSGRASSDTSPEPAEMDYDNPDDSPYSLDASGQSNASSSLIYAKDPSRRRKSAIDPMDSGGSFNADFDSAIMSAAKSAVESAQSMNSKSNKRTWNTNESMINAEKRRIQENAMWSQEPPHGQQFPPRFPSTIPHPQGRHGYYPDGSFQPQFAVGNQFPFQNDNLQMNSAVSDLMFNMPSGHPESNLGGGGRNSNFRERVPESPNAFPLNFSVFSDPPRLNAESRSQNQQMPQNLDFSQHHQSSTSTSQLLDAQIFTPTTAQWSGSHSGDAQWPINSSSAIQFSNLQLSQDMPRKPPFDPNKVPPNRPGISPTSSSHYHRDEEIMRLRRRTEQLESELHQRDIVISELEAEVQDLKSHQKK